MGDPELFELDATTPFPILVQPAVVTGPYTHPYLLAAVLFPDSQLLIVEFEFDTHQRLIERRIRERIAPEGDSYVVRLRATRTVAVVHSSNGQLHRFSLIASDFRKPRAILDPVSDFSLIDERSMLILTPNSKVFEAYLSQGVWKLGAVRQGFSRISGSGPCVAERKDGSFVALMVSGELVELEVPEDIPEVHLVSCSFPLVMLSDHCWYQVDNHHRIRSASGDIDELDLMRIRPAGPDMGPLFLGITTIGDLITITPGQPRTIIATSIYDASITPFGVGGAITVCLKHGPSTIESISCTIQHSFASPVPFEGGSKLRRTMSSSSISSNFSDTSQSPTSQSPLHSSFAKLKRLPSRPSLKRSSSALIRSRSRTGLLK